MINLYGLPQQKLEELVISMGQKKFRAIQLYTWIYEKGVTNFDEMSDISASFREVMKKEFCLTKPTIFKRQDSKDGTIKLLLELNDGSKVETVLMRYNYGNVACVSSEVGCNMGCAFCASGILRKTRDLSASEMVGEVLVLNDILKEEGERVSHVVVMGTGEPFDNYDNVLDFVRIINNQKALAIGARHITVSTCGLPDKIRQYANEGLQINLAISLHASNNEIRNQIMRVNHAYPIEEVIEAAKYYESVAKRRVTFEYILLAGLNDSIENADELSDLIRGMLAYVNLIPFNEVKEKPYKRSSEQAIRAFYERLNKRGVNATIRKEFGTDIDAACGQLRAKYTR